MVEKIKPSMFFDDEVGHSTLSNISSAGKFNQWMYETITQFCNGNILEVGGGIGNISQCFISDKKKLTVTELQDQYCEILSNNLIENSFIQNVICMNVVDPEFDKKHQSLFYKFDSVFALNVVEHIENDSLAIQNCKKLLKPGGQLIILVPAFNFLYNTFDDSLGHFKRYKKRGLIELFENNEFEVIHKQYFNFVGTLGWWVSGNLLRKKVVPEGQMKLYDFFVPIIKMIDLFTNRFIGLSVIVVGKNK